MDSSQKRAGPSVQCEKPRFLAAGHDLKVDRLQKSKAESGSRIGQMLFHWTTTFLIPLNYRLHSLTFVDGGQRPSPAFKRRATAQLILDAASHHEDGALNIVHGDY